MPNAKYIYCLNGHNIATVKLTAESPRPFCTDCGKGVISACQNCQEPVDPTIKMKRPAHCGGCGKPFPWTETAIQAANEYTDEIEELSPEDKVALKETFPDLATDTPRTPLAMKRFKRILSGAGSMAQEVVTKILTDVMTDGAKKLLLGP
jgi:hypothetical protein